jgi:hypothetical protein
MQESTNAKDWMIKNLASYLVLAHFKPAIEAAAMLASIDYSKVNNSSSKK